MLLRSEKCDFHPKGTSNRPFFPLLFHMLMCSRLTIVFPAELNQKSISQAKNTIKQKKQGFYERWLAVEIERLVLRSGPRRGRRSADKCLPAPWCRCFFWDENPHDQISEWYLHAGLKVSVIPAVTCDTRPEQDPWSNLDASLWVGPNLGEEPPTPPRLFNLSCGDVKHESSAAAKVAFMSTEAMIKDTLIARILCSCLFFKGTWRLQCKSLSLLSFFKCQPVPDRQYSPFPCRGKCPELLFHTWRCPRSNGRHVSETGRKRGGNRWTFWRRRLQNLHVLPENVNWAITQRTV